jgi:hypothetical protein
MKKANIEVNDGRGLLQNEAAFNQEIASYKGIPGARGSVFCLFLHNGRHVIRDFKRIRFWSPQVIAVRAL